MGQLQIRHTARAFACFVVPVTLLYESIASDVHAAFFVMLLIVFDDCVVILFVWMCKPEGKNHTTVPLQSTQWLSFQLLNLFCLGLPSISPNILQKFSSTRLFPYVISMRVCLFISEVLCMFQFCFLFRSRVRRSLLVAATLLIATVALFATAAAQDPFGSVRCSSAWLYVVFNDAAATIRRYVDRYTSKDTAPAAAKMMPVIFVGCDGNRAPGGLRGSTLRQRLVAPSTDATKSTASPRTAATAAAAVSWSPLRLFLILMLLMLQTLPWLLHLVQRQCMRVVYRHARGKAFVGRPIMSTWLGPILGACGKANYLTIEAHLVCYSLWPLCLPLCFLEGCCVTTS